MAGKTRKARAPLALVTDPHESAKAAGLVYFTDDRPGIRRRAAGRGFTFIDPKGERIRDPEEIARIRAIGIPPAWTDVWICPSPRGHILATGRDARGRKQYRYHPAWRKVRDETKYHRMIAFGETLPTIRERVTHDLGRAGLPREKVLATVVRLLEVTLVRVGNDEYARANASYGLTTLRDEHVEIRGEHLFLCFRGKHGRQYRVSIDNRRVARVVKACHELPGHELFQYVGEEGRLERVHSGDVNDYLRELSGEHFTAKDFRTWAGTILAAHELAARHEWRSATQAKRHIVAAVDAVAARLGNTRAICRRCYIHPAVFDAYLDRSLQGALAQNMQRSLNKGPFERLHPHEAAVVALLCDRLPAPTSAKRHLTRMAA